MKKMSLFYLLMGLACLTQAQVAFDPERDTIALCNQRGVWKILVPASTLIAAAEQVTPALTAVDDVRIQDIHGKPYIFFRGRSRANLETGYTVMVLLNEVSAGVWMAGNIFQACWGNVCAACGFDEYWGCACERYDGAPDEVIETYCEHRVSLGMGLAKIPNKH